MLSEKILRVEQIAPGICKMTIESEYIAGNALAGQFVNVKMQRRDKCSAQKAYKHLQR